MTIKAAIAKKRLGIFYSPLNATEILCGWAIRSARDLVLEPSFGGCSFLQSSKDKFVSLGNKSPNRQLFGADVDPTAFNHLSKKVGPVDIRNRFLLADFLSLGTSDFSAKNFCAVVGNPPYTAHRDMMRTQRTTAYKAMRSAGFRLNRASSLWAYFVIHSLRFIRDGGRMAWLLPGSLLQTFYGRDIVTILERRFSDVRLLRLSQKLFLDEGTKENTIVLLADGWKEGPASRGASICQISTLQELSAALSVNKKPTPIARRIYPSLSIEGERKFVQLQDLRWSSDLGGLVDIKIGVVTGNNGFFLLDEETKKRALLAPSDFRLIFSKLEISKGLNISKWDLSKARKKNKKCLLLSPRRTPPAGSGLKKYLDKYKRVARDKVFTFEKREIWYRPDDDKDPDAFLSYMCHVAPRLIINTARTTSTNSIHRIYFKKRPSLTRKKLVAISLLTTFSNLSAELVGRCYGEGVLKLEPSEARRIRLYIPPKVAKRNVDEAFKKINELLRLNRFADAQQAADKFIFKVLVKREGPELLDILSQELRVIRNRRFNKRI